MTKGRERQWTARPQPPKVRFDRDLRPSPRTQLGEQTALVTIGANTVTQVGLLPTIIEQFRATALRRRNSVAFRSPSTAEDGSQTWEIMLWQQYGELVDQLAATFINWGIRPGDRVAILATNRWEWQVTDLATLMIGAVSVPIYPTSSEQQVSYILGHSEARLCVVGNGDLLGKIVAQKGSALERVVLIDVVNGVNEQHEIAGPVTLEAYADALASGAAALSTDPTLVTRRSGQVKLADLASIVYTSGTTGPPKGVLLTHANISATVDMVSMVVPIGPQDRFLSFLPLSHIAERVMSHFGQIASGGETWFARSISTLAEDLVSCRPTIFFAVPRVWEKVRDALEIETAKTHGLQRLMLTRYRAVAMDGVDQVRRARLFRHVNALELAVLDRLVGHKIRVGLGLDQARSMCSGAAPIDPALLRWLVGAGLHVGEVYGQTEGSGPTTISPPGAIHIGSVGPAMPGVKLRIADDGEILMRGNNVCAGYFRNEQATVELIDADGWMHTGDLGVLDSDGYLHITGRKKDLMKTAGGKYIAPQELELRLRSCRFITNAVVVAEGRPYVTALLTLDAEAVGPWAVHRGKPASIEALSMDPDVLAEVAREVEVVNRDMNHAEQVKRWQLLPRELTLDAGEITPTLKVVRPVVLDHFAHLVEQLYAPLR